MEKHGKQDEVNRPAIKDYGEEKSGIKIPSTTLLQIINQQTNNASQGSKDLQEKK